MACQVCLRQVDMIQAMSTFFKANVRMVVAIDEHL